ncbi:Zinc finger MYM-type protein 1 [Dissostichus eleginoides]|uniref:Zinc finger MYM-type protein 1 n=1 Tax=Dissostichus eleginoides TaxID=100907 RepID=A0AAD9BZB0_DISEL|nr:Zinc finger MYM-type protein 1 [Dissostichus eleginoides]
MLRRRKLHTVFPNTDIALRLFLTLPVTNASGERSFSKLAFVKNRLRSSMQQERVSNLTLMSIEHDILREMDFKNIIKAFSSKKTRRKHF